MSTPPDQAVVVELERLRGTMEAGFARVDGKLEVSLQRHTSVEADVTALEQRVAALERSRWPLPSLAAVVGVAALLVSLYSAVAH
ncbi:hypothetical protein [Streptomyces mobaraensis]|uniref:DUF3618 domain-containing protein n=1 Tax=Streptomyces mobaraensis TaxID=35621 RepID=A0A5N5WCW3_STRMB|nr:hypothetical protein [Streptomyces mobaraensis]KAB7850113.1 hypothetical protein FRZ00_05800 [Streptomyces mobaraensis]